MPLNIVYSPSQSEESSDEDMENLLLEDILADNFRPQMETFHLFALFPVELRLKIWQFSWLEQDIKMKLRWALADHDEQGEQDDDNETEPSEIDYDELQNSDTGSIAPFQPDYAHRYPVAYSDYGPPATLWVNHESRDETLRHYTILLEKGGPQKEKLWFNPKIDIITLTSYTTFLSREGGIFQLRCSKLLENVEVLVIYVNLFDDDIIEGVTTARRNLKKRERIKKGSSSDRRGWVWMHFKALRELHFISTNEDYLTQIGRSCLKKGLLVTHYHALSNFRNQVPDPGIELYIKWVRDETPFELPSFGKLALEIRLEVWSLACFRPSRIDLYYRRTKSLGSRRFTTHRRTNPSVLPANQESRRETLKYCQVLLEGTIAGDKTVYYNPDVDTMALWFVPFNYGDSLFHELGKDVLQKLWYLEIHQMGWSDLYGDYIECLESESEFQSDFTYETAVVWRQFTNLKLLTFIGEKFWIFQGDQTIIPVFEHLDGAEDCERVVQALFERMGLKDPAYNVPAVLAFSADDFRQNIKIRIQEVESLAFLPPFELIPKGYKLVIVFENE
ncbi:hypothetical protein G7Y89_g6799 [Cudoniella acicularis]|uniref:2EXR domain-containing protein n=1 Tax=Cudoniella acicularis TaxID=354080 RepID=A0A8H4RMB3_9HELO|nr:hypothetical protein G7Y89_g6799 [Cudoniella acicularis]